MHGKARLPFTMCWLVLLCLAAGVAQGQSVSIGDRTVKPKSFDMRSLDEGTSLAGQGFDVPGMDLFTKAAPRHAFGDDSTYAARVLMDTTWSRLRASEDSVAPGVQVHWVRYHLLPEPELQGVPLLLNVQVRGDLTVFLNGEELLHSVPLPVPSGTLLPHSDSVPRVSLPIRLLNDGAPEVLAIRVKAAMDEPLRTTGLQVTLHRADISYQVQRSMLHYGVFIGINGIIFLLALVIGWSERKDRSWLLLAALSLVSVLSTYCDLVGDVGTLGLATGTARALGMVDTMLLPWSPYLLIMVLSMLRGRLTPTRARRYTTGVLIMTILCAAVVLAEVSGMVDSTAGLTFKNDITTSFLGLVLLLSLVFVVIVFWFGVEVIRLGIQLVRTKGYERWVGAGALVSSLLTLVFGIASTFSSIGLSGWLSVLSDYCSYVAVPVSVAVYLAIRSVHHNRLVERQRDDLDEEVKERTAQLRAEKERSDDLLLNILPREVAEELKDTGAAAAKHFDQATVLFTDFSGFTQLSERVSPQELVAELNACFKEFDAVLSKYHIEKIKTIGDAYMAAGGLPDPQHGSPADMVRAALDMQECMVRHKAERKAAGKPYFEMRVGIHTGPVVAGIVGVKKFQYDIWGDTVNTASRMESSGEIGKVNISEATYRLVVGEQLSVVRAGDGSQTTDNQQLTTVPAFTFTPRGKVQAKGKGEMEMFFVHRASEGA